LRQHHPILETDDPRDVNAFLRPLLPLMRGDVRAIVPLDFEEDLGKLRQRLAPSS
jgi:hypothetical protein